MLDFLLNVIEFEILPKTRKNIALGDKVFGAAIIDYSRRKTIVASTNKEHSGNCPLWHGEITAIFDYYSLPSADRSQKTSDLIFLSTHEPCPMCASAIAWAGFKEVWFLFDYQSTSQQFLIPHDVNILNALFGVNELNYDNDFFRMRPIEGVLGDTTQQRIEKLRHQYMELSMAYQAQKDGNSIPFK